MVLWKFGSFDIVFTFGGCGEVCCFDDLERHDQMSGRWSAQEARGKPPTRRMGHSLNLLGAPWGQSLVAFGGWGGDGPVSSSVKAFGIGSNTWVAVATSGSPPVARWAHSATNIGTSRMLVFGGEGELPGQYLNDVHLFDAGRPPPLYRLPRADHTPPRHLPLPPLSVCVACPARCTVEPACQRSIYPHCRPPPAPTISTRT